MKKESRRPAGWVLLFSFLVSLFTLTVYLLETGLSDDELKFLLVILRYSSFAVCVCSLFFLIAGIISLFKKFEVKHLLQVVFSVIGVFYGTVIILVDALIATLTGGQA